MERKIGDTGPAHWFIVAGVRLQTDRLILRPPNPADFDAFFDMHNDPEVLQYLPVTAPPGDRGVAWRTFALLLGHWQMRGWGQWVVCDRQSDEIVGRVGLWYPEGWPAIEVGWVIRRSSWGRGFATEAAQAAVQYGFEVVGTDHLISIIRHDNTRSIRIAEKLGETLERTEMQHGREHLIYGIRRPRPRVPKILT